MSTINTGGPAFPCDNLLPRDARGQYVGLEVSSTGMTLRDAAALRAMPVILAFPRPLDYDQVAHHSYRMADAMLRARDKAGDS